MPSMHTTSRFMIELVEGSPMRVTDVLEFAMGLTELGYKEPCDDLRRIMGAFVLDALQYNEHWRLAQSARTSLAEKWPGFFSD